MMRKKWSAEAGTGRSSQRSREATLSAGAGARSDAVHVAEHGLLVLSHALVALLGILHLHLGLLGEHVPLGHHPLTLHCPEHEKLHGLLGDHLEPVRLDHNDPSWCDATAACTIIGFDNVVSHEWAQAGETVGDQNSHDKVWPEHHVDLNNNAEGGKDLSNCEDTPPNSVDRGNLVCQLPPVGSLRIR